jgi:hypothetical protein
MNDHNTLGDRSRKLIKVIDEVAFQTSILALFAAVTRTPGGKPERGEPNVLASETVAAQALSGRKIVEQLKALAGGAAQGSGKSRPIAHRCAGSAEDRPERRRARR